MFAAAQGVQTGTLSGTVQFTDGSPLPGVTITIESPALQGKRTISSGPSGEYVFKLLPPGQYTVTFELAGMAKIVENAEVPLGGAARADARLGVARASESVDVIGQALDVDRTAVHGSNFGRQQVDQLPIAPTGRTVDQIAALAPAVTQKTPNAGQLQISGGFSYDNVFLVDGVDVDDHFFANPTNNLVIEDAIEQTQVLTSGISAEYGRFSGGVVNAITKSGGNTYHGSFRTDFTNDSWRADTPFENANGIRHPSRTNEVYTATAGGKVVTDRLWFFVAGRYFDNQTQQTLPISAQTFDATDREPRIEAKLTANVSEAHTLQGAYTYSDEKLTRVAFPFTIDRRAVEHPDFPARLYVANYHGVLSSNLFASLQYSEKRFQFRGSGGTSPDIRDSPMICASLNLCEFNAPYFDATDPESRNNKQWAGSVNYFLTTPRLGSHDMKVGGEVFKTIEIGGNSQSATNYTFNADYANNGGVPVFDANGNLIPTFEPGETVLFHWLPIRGAQGDLKTSAVYFNDAWKVNANLAANLGVRYERVDGTGPTGARLTKNHALVPRLGVSYDVGGNGRYVVSGTYAQYAGGSNPNNFLNTTNVANPNVIFYVYDGPGGQGRDFAPGFDLTNYKLAGGTFPTANVSNAGNLRSPVVTEYTASVGGRFSNATSAAVTYVYRNTRNFIDDFITFDQGQTEVVVGGVDYGRFDNIAFKNTSALRRRYEAIDFQGRSAITRNWSADLAYTYMLRFEGNFEGEAANQPATTSLFGNYPEIIFADRSFPFGRLLGFQRHKVRFLTSYNVPTNFGRFAFGVVYRFDSGTPYSFLATNQPVSALQLSRDPGYANPPATQTVYFGGRGSQLFPSQSRFDLAVNYDVPIWKNLSPWLKVTLFNAFNTHYLQAFNTSIVPNGPGPTDANGIPTTFTRTAAFGTARSALDYQAAREFQLSAGIRF